MSHSQSQPVTEPVSQPVMVTGETLDYLVERDVERTVMEAELYVALHLVPYSSQELTLWASQVQHIVK